MGLFRDKGVCDICESNTGKEIKDGFLCKECAQRGGQFLLKTGLGTKEQTIKLVKSCMYDNAVHLAKQKKRTEKYVTTKKVANFLSLDETNRLFKCNKSNTIYKYEDLVDFELMENGESIVKGGLGRAVAGGMMFGGVGAIVGGVTGGKKTKGICSSLRIRLALKGYPDENTYLDIITSDTKVKGFIYKSMINIANDILVILSSITNSTQDQVSSPRDEEQDNSTISNLNEIKKLKELLDIGAITQEEFDAKKKQLLGL